MTAQTPGSAAHEEWKRQFDVNLLEDWHEDLSESEHAGWTSVAMSAINVYLGQTQVERDALEHAAAREPQPSPELAAAMRETRRYREALMRTREALARAADDAQRRLRIAQSVVTAALDGREKAGLPPVED